ncbi:LssY C-terminal domain-containing protein [Posidoniimonas polymericola]|uniref:LssY C-terminal domain-containing protein n=1 Tax=Posidoniimonas polymericola TaxID=2528002 RepID=UPI001E61E7E1|nr:LssY C-terminal domain-containing protein [Posidoniimonas polymericola]
MANEHTTAAPRRRVRPAVLLKGAVSLLAAWLMLAYLIMPMVWSEYAQRHPTFDENPRVTQTADHHPGDPLNVALVGAQTQIQSLMAAADWYAAVGLGLDSDLKIAADTVLSRPDDDAPVSSLYLFGRKEDLAFEQPVGDNPRHRHHVRLWKTGETTADGRPKWIGSAVYDQRVGFSHTTGAITHVTAPDVDAERDYLFKCLEATEKLADQYVIPNFHKQLEGLNGGGDPWQTGGSLYVGIVADEADAN